MNPPSQFNTREPSEGAYEALLRRLDLDRDRAWEKLEEIRQRLIKLFAKHGCTEPDTLADETINRCATRIGEGTVIKSEPIAYFLGIARHVRHQHIRKLSQPFDPPPTIDVEELERETECLRKCSQLHSEQYEFVAKYLLADEQGRLQMARQMAVSIKGLRTRIHRLREELRECRRKCLRKFEESKII